MAQTNDDQLKAKVDAYVDEVWEDVVKDIRTLVRIESVENLSAAEPGKPYGPKANEALVAAEGIASRLGLAVTDLDGRIGYGEVVGREGAPYVATIAHSDIVPVGLGWTVPALDVTRREGYLMGRSVLDDKGPLVLSLWAAHFFARQVKETGEPLPYALRCIIGNNEETNMADVEHYLDRCPEPAFCFSPDADFPLICGEKGLYSGSFTSEPMANGVIEELDGGTVSNAIPGQATAVVCVDAKALPAAAHVDIEAAGEGRARITAHGKGGHASMPEGTVNAICVLADYLLANVPDLTDTEKRWLHLEHEVCHTGNGRPLGIAAADDKFGELTCIGGTVRTRGDRFVQTVDSRYPTSTTGSRITVELRRFATRFHATFEEGRDVAPFYIDPGSPEIKTLLATYEEYTGRKGEAFTIGGGTYARHFRRACAFGPHEPYAKVPSWVGMEHGPDEAVSEESLRRALKIYIVSIARLMELELAEPEA
jgi:succinyl-diaminopimelate desuccinylase